MMMGDMGPMLAKTAIFALLLVVAGNLVYRISARHPDGRHWLLRTLALLSPTCLLAAVIVGNVGPHLLDSPGGVSSNGTLWMTSMVLILIGALCAPVCWRVVLQQRLGRNSSSLPFFHATRAQLWALYVLAGVYKSIIPLDITDVPDWLLETGPLQLALRVLMTLVGAALLSAMLTLPVMALRAVARRSLERMRTLLGRASQG